MVTSFFATRLKNNVHVLALGLWTHDVSETGNSIRRCAHGWLGGSSAGLSLLLHRGSFVFRAPGARLLCCLRYIVTCATEYTGGRSRVLGKSATIARKQFLLSARAVASAIFIRTLHTRSCLAAKGTIVSQRRFSSPLLSVLVFRLTVYAGRSQGRPRGTFPPKKNLTYLVILCFGRRYRKKNTVARPKIIKFVPPKFFCPLPKF